MGETCKDCRSWEEEIFWTHFQSIHFSQFLHDGFEQKLVIPEKFAANFKKKLPETVALKGPSGITWNVGLTTKDDALFFDYGWQEFVKDHFLEEKDLLVFKYNGVSHFDVLMFDGRSLCEKAASYFVRRCGHEEHESGCHAKRKETESFVDVIHTSSRCDVEGTPQKSTNNDISTIPLRQPVISPAANKKMRSGVYSVKPFHTRQNLRCGELSDFDGDVEAKPDSGHMSISTKVAYDPQYASNRKPVTEHEKKNALLLAQAATTDEGFLVVMRPTHVYKKFYMSIPSVWVNKHLSRENQDMVLRINKNTWHMRFYYNKPRHSGGLATGWRNFALDNYLDEFDVCVFEPSSPASNPIILDVGIFRVVQAALPLTQVSPEPQIP